jgi:hypothetical protein
MALPEPSMFGVQNGMLLRWAIGSMRVRVDTLVRNIEEKLRKNLARDCVDRASY